MILWLFVACGSKANTPAPEVAEPVVASRAPSASFQTEKASAPVTFARTDTERGSSVTVTFTAPGKNLVVRAWGASGLEASAVVRELASVESGQEVTLEIPHVGSGDLALSVAGTWSGVTGDDVRSFTIGERTPAVVPTRTVDGKKVKGWSASPR